MQKGERVLLHAAASGVGTAAVQIAKQLGAIVVGTSRSKQKLETLKTLNCDEVIDTSIRGFREQLTAPVDVIVDPLGAPAFADNLASLTLLGRLVMLGFLQQRAPRAQWITSVCTGALVLGAAGLLRGRVQPLDGRQ